MARGPGPRPGGRSHPSSASAPSCPPSQPAPPGAPRLHLRGVRHLGRRRRRSPTSSPGSSRPRSTATACASFGAPSTDLFHACCERYGATRGSTRLFSLTDTLLLLAVLMHRIDGDRGRAGAVCASCATSTRPRSSRCACRTCRSSSSRSRVHAHRRPRRPRHLQPEPGGRRARQARRCVSSNPSSRRRWPGWRTTPSCAAPWPRSTSTPPSRAGPPAFEAVFEPELWPMLTGALLATGEYQRDYPDCDMHRFGSPTTESVWRLLLVDRGDRAALERVRTVLGTLLDRVAASDGRREVGPGDRLPASSSTSGPPPASSTGATTWSATRRCARATPASTTAPTGAWATS